MFEQFAALDGYLRTNRNKEVTLSALTRMVPVGTKRKFDLQKFKEIAVVRPDFFSCTWKKQDLCIRATTRGSGSLEEISSVRSAAFKDALVNKFSSYLSSAGSFTAANSAAPTLYQLYSE